MQGVANMDMKSGRKRVRTRWRTQDTELTLLALPTTIWYILFCFLPMFGLVIAFKNFKIHGGFLSNVIHSEWTGFKNFEFLFKSNDAWVVIRNTLGYNMIFIVLGIAIPVILALMIGQLHSGKAPTQIHAGTYSAVMHYLKAVEAVGSTSGADVTSKMKETPVTDFYSDNTPIREDGRVLRDMHVFQVKAPEDSNHAWDIYTQIMEIDGSEAYRPLSEGNCPLVAAK